MDDTRPADTALADRLDRSPAFRLLARAIPDVLLVLDERERVAYAGEGAEALVGAGGLVGRPFRDLVDPESAGALPDRLRPDRARGEGGTWEVRFRSGRWASLSATDASGLSGPGADGDVLEHLDGHVLLFAREVGHERVARDRLDLFRRALDATDNLVIVADVTQDDAPVVFVNEHFLDVTGYAREEVVGRNWRFLQRRPDGTRDDDQPGLAQLGRAVAAGEAVRVVLRSYTKGGRPFWHELFVTPIEDGSGAPTHLVGVLNDVTDRVEDAAERAELEAALEQSAGALVVTDADLEGGPAIRYVNRAFERMTGWTRDEVVGRSPRLMQGAPTDRAELDRIRAALEAGEPYRGEVTNVRKNGDPYVVELDIAPVRDGSGAVVRFVSTQHDVTERRRLEAEVLEAQGRAEAALARDLHDGVGQVLSGTAYHLHALAQDLEAEGSAHAARAARAAALVQDAQREARALAHGLFPLAVAAGGLEAELERLAAETAAAYGVECRFVCPAPVAVEPPDRATDLYRIAQEAVSNAVRHGRPRAVCLRLDAPPAAGRSPGDALAVLSVEDDGVGLPGGALADGGIGLQTMRYRARRLGGSLEVAARAVGGTAVRVRFPLQSALASGGAAVASARGA